MAAEILDAHSITPVMVTETRAHSGICLRGCPNRADGVINFTASHNPRWYNRIKFSTPDRRPSVPELIHQIAAEIEAADGADFGGRRRR
jgi:phosphomannomutase